MYVKDIMHTAVTTVTPETRVSTAYQRMTTRDAPNMMHNVGRYNAGRASPRSPDLLPGMHLWESQIPWQV